MLELPGRRLGILVLAPVAFEIQSFDSQLVPKAAFPLLRRRATWLGIRLTRETVVRRHSDWHAAAEFVSETSQYLYGENKGPSGD